MPRYEFTTGQVLTADQMNDLSDQTVMTFAGTAARGSAIPTPVEGMLTYLEDADELQVYTNAWEAIAGGKILQVVSTTKTDTFTTTSATFVDITGLSASITPESTSSKIYVAFETLCSANGGSNGIQFQLLRDATAIGIGDAAGSRTRVTASFYGGDGASGNAMTTMAASLLDSPNTTSSTTYKVQARSTSSGQTTAINRNVSDGDAASSPRAISTITLIEVAG